MRRVVVTGLGIVSCIGNTKKEVIENLKNLNSGIVKAPEYEQYSFRSLIHGKPEIDIDKIIDRRIRRFMGDGAAYNYIAMKNAIEDSGLKINEVSNEMTGIIVGSGGPSTLNMFNAFKELWGITGYRSVEIFLISSNDVYKIDINLFVSSFFFQGS